MSDSNQTLLEPLVEIARAAGAEILKVRDRGFDVEHKADSSPLTEADTASHGLIIRRLAELTPDIPVLSEESAEIPFAERRTWDRYWLIDPLDGTKEFIKGGTDFTVNIALIVDHAPIIGIVYAPASELMYSACEGVGAFKHGADGPQPLQVARPGTPLRVVASRSHRSERLETFLGALGEIEAVAIGSSLKFCLVAEGSADLYPRLGPTCEWDTGAGHCVAACAGADVTLLDGSPLRYNTKDEYLNPEFMVSADASIGWQAALPTEETGK